MKTYRAEDDDLGRAGIECSPSGLPRADAEGVSTCSISQADVTGRGRMTQNVLISWAWHLVYIVAGMLLPPMINRQLHQETLGIWYFAWGLVNYFGLLSLGVMGTVSRYVARYRAVRDAQNMNNTVRTGLLIYLCTGAAVLGLTILAVALLPSVFGSRLAGHVLQAQWVVLLLGLSLVVEFVFGVFQSILTGCYRFGTQHAITSGVYILAAGGMIVSLLAGAGLQTMAGIAVMEKLIAGILRMAASYRFCDGLRISTGTVSLRFAGELLRFGFKSILASVSRILTYQTPAIRIMTCLGPGPLALYGPAAALVRHVDMLVSKFANVFTPTASALDAQGGKESLRELFVKGTQYGLYTSLPMVAVLVFLGGTILPLWMREETYRQGATVLTILAIGHVALFSQRATWQILTGLGHHGLPGVSALLSAVCSIPLAFLTLGVLDWGLVGAGLSLALPLTVVNSVVVPVYACRVLRIRWYTYIMQSASGPVLAMLPFVLCLLVIHFALPGKPVLAMLCGVCVGGAILAPIYWYRVIPFRLRLKASRLLRQAVGAQC